MGERLFRELASFEDRQGAASEAVAWGFPREISHDEIQDSYWFRLGDDVIFWFESVESLPGLWIHLAVSPPSRYRWPAVRWLFLSEQIARELGHDRLHYNPFGDERDGKIPNYLARLGWVPNGYGMTRMLGDELHG